MSESALNRPSLRHTESTDVANREAEKEFS